MDIIKNLPQAGVPTVNIRFALNEIRSLEADPPQVYPIHFGNGFFLPGMTIWDYYFTAALNAILSGYSTVAYTKDPQEIIELANEYANLMMYLRQIRLAPEPEDPPAPVLKNRDLE
jgi:hypothetical protein